jgi:hypothetical protein
MSMLQGQHINTQHLEEMGSKFAEALVKVRTRPLRMNGQSSNGALLPVPPTGYIDDEYVLRCVKKISDFNVAAILRIVMSRDQQN